MYRRTSSPEPLAGRNNVQDPLSSKKMQLSVQKDVVIDVGQEVEEYSCHVNGAFEEDAGALKTATADAAGEPVRASERTAAIWRYANEAKLWMRLRSQHLRRVLWLLVLVTYNIYLGFAIFHTWLREPSWCHGVKFLVLITSIPYACVFIKTVAKPYLLRLLQKPVAHLLSRFQYLGKWTWAAAWCGVLIFLVIDTHSSRYRMVSAGGLLVLLCLGYIFSSHPRKVAWHSVQCGVMAQFVFGLVVLRWQVGRSAFECLGDKVKQFLEFTDQGSSFVFGYLVSGQLEGLPIQPAVFAFKVLCTVIFFNFLVSILYYFGLMQILVINLGWFLQQVMGTTACESMNAAGNIFLGMTEAPLVIRPYLPRMTKSELHAVLTGGFATIAGSVMAAYISFGVNASHLLSASVMSAPAALAFSKLCFPETEESVTRAEDIQVEIAQETNALEAASNGASAAVKLVSNIAANLVAFLAFIYLMDSLIVWLGSMVDLKFLSLEWLMSKLFVPVSLIMGVPWPEKEQVANLIGLKTVINEFVAYNKLSELQKAHLLSPRSEALATFALCGFSNFGSIGIQVGVLGAMAPGRKAELASLALRAMIAGCAACFMTACVAGTLLTDID